MTKHKLYRKAKFISSVVMIEQTRRTIKQPINTRRIIAIHRSTILITLNYCLKPKKGNAFKILVYQFFSFKR